jgi:hypothetical protein
MGWRWVGRLFFTTKTCLVLWTVCAFPSPDHIQNRVPIWCFYITHADMVPMEAVLALPSLLLPYFCVSFV